jgi:hypothetical protein
MADEDRNGLLSFAFRWRVGNGEFQWLKGMKVSPSEPAAFLILDSLSRRVFQRGADRRIAQERIVVLKGRQFIENVVGQS